MSLLSPSTTGTPEILKRDIKSSASCSVRSFVRENGLVITPFSLRLTLSTSAACCSIVIFLWIIPIPPSRAIAIAIADSVTVSIAELISGMFSVMSLAKVVWRSASFGVKSDA